VGSASTVLQIRARVVRRRASLLAAMPSRGGDPPSIERSIFYRMTLVQHPYTSLTGTVSGIDFALSDVSHKIKGQPV